VEVLKILEENGFYVAPYKIVKDFQEALSYAEYVNYPVVMKLPIQEHKTDKGAVVLDIYTEKMLEASWHYFKQKFKAEEIMIQKQIKEGIELYAGIKHDENFGKVMLFGLGGIYIEIFKDITSRLCPITKHEAFEMINEIKAHKIFNYRGRNVNVEALVNFLVKLSKFALKEDVKEMDINPFKISEKCIIIDARLRK
jgi:succinyl-CoA synthetase beta subunit